ncbi:MAG: hypothetical protein AAF411_19440 [Myxococcota bacterium]
MSQDDALQRALDRGEFDEAERLAEANPALSELVDIDRGLRGLRTEGPADEGFVAGVMANLDRELEPLDEAGLAAWLKDEDGANVGAAAEAQPAEVVPLRRRFPTTLVVAAAAAIGLVATGGLFLADQAPSAEVASYEAVQDALPGAPAPTSSAAPAPPAAALEEPAPEPEEAQAASDAVYGLDFADEAEGATEASSIAQGASAAGAAENEVRRPRAEADDSLIAGLSGTPTKRSRRRARPGAATARRGAGSHGSVLAEAPREQTDERTAGDGEAATGGFGVTRGLSASAPAAPAAETQAPSTAMSAPPRDLNPQAAQTRALACVPDAVSAVRVRFRIEGDRVVRVRSTTPELGDDVERCILRVYQGAAISGTEVQLRR